MPTKKTNYSNDQPLIVRNLLDKISFECLRLDERKQELTNLLKNLTKINDVILILEGKNLQNARRR
jgi:hypothetical protein